MAKPRIYVLPHGALYEQIMVPRVTEVLDSFCEWERNPHGRDLTPEELLEVAQSHDGILGSWGKYRITRELLAQAPRLRIVAHAAGSLRALVEPEVLREGFVFTNASAGIAPYVAEHALCLAIASLRGLGEHVVAMRTARTWGNPDFKPNRTLYDATVGLVGLGQVGRCVPPLLQPFRCRMLGYDPYLAPERAQALGVELTSLPELLAASLVVSLHAPIIPETKHMIGAKELALMGDGAVLVNTARGWLVDHEALLAEVRTGRLRAALDVTEPEPLPAESELRDTPGVILTPHIAGPTWDRRWDLAYLAACDLRAFFAGERPRYQVTYEMLESMA